MVNIFVAITDDDWFSYLAAQPQLDEVNFWQPRGKAGFHAIRRGELFLFKLHSPHNFIVGGGIFDRASSNVPLWLAWDTFGTLNGADTFEEMRRRISRYTHQPADDRTEIGCRLLEAPLYEAPCVNALLDRPRCGRLNEIRNRPRLVGLRRSPASPYIRSARIGAWTHIPHAWGSREVEADGTHLFDGNQSPGGCRSTSFPVRRRQPVEDAASKLAYAFNSAPSGTSPSLR
jgi:hypothetical protein